MRGLFWNSNGLRDQVKPRFLFDSTREHKLDFIAIIESKRKYVNPQELAHLCANKNFSWYWTPPRGNSAGILVGVDLDKFQIQNIVRGNFFMKFKLDNTDDNFEWLLIAVNGTAKEVEKEDFLSELV
jgi:hypothetical protein